MSGTEIRREADVRLIRRPRNFAAPLIIAIGLSAIAVELWAFGAFAADNAPGPVAVRSQPMLPDLAMGPIKDIAVGTTENGQQRLRFAAAIVNLGEGEFIVTARRPWIGGDWSVTQWIEERGGGGYSTHVAGSVLVFGGDGHEHWHIKHVEAHQIETLEGEVLGRLVKEGFCFFDTDAYRLTLPGAPDDAHWRSRGCAGAFDTRVRMGLSIGWADTYPWHLLDERIDVTHVPDGIYRIRQIADPNGEFLETDETNNETWVTIELFTNADGLREATALEAGPAP